MPPKKVLFVCTGNTCRSVLAQHLAKLADTEGNFEFSSAGIAAHPAFPIPPFVIKLLREHGVKQFHHTPTPLTAEHVRWADFIFVMENHHLEAIHSRHPESRGKTVLLSESSEISDPIGGSEEVYRSCLEEIKESLEAALRKL